MGPAPRYLSPLLDAEGPPKFRCGLCPRRCVIPPGGSGRCAVRTINQEGRGRLPFYGFITALAEDPIEKKPLYHFRPGSTILSVGFAGCNLFCPFCQNHHISQTTDAPGRCLGPEELISLTRQRGLNQIAYTYSEPLIHIEYLLDCMELSRRSGIANVLVTNGCIEGEAAAAVLTLTDGVNIDLKCFSEKTYAEILGGSLQAVCGFIKGAHEAGVHTEVTTLVVPGLNDGAAELDRAAAFLEGLSPEIPWHLSAYHPAWRWSAPATDPEALVNAAKRARKTLRYVYTGNIPGESGDTLCPHCGAVLVKRQGWRVDTAGLVLKEGGDGKACFCRRCLGVARFSLTSTCPAL